MEKNCHDCYFATEINTGTYRCRRKKYDIEKKTCFTLRKELMEKDREADEAYRKLHEINERKDGDNDGESL